MPTATQQTHCFETVHRMGTCTCGICTVLTVSTVQLVSVNKKGKICPQLLVLLTIFRTAVEEVIRSLTG